MEELTVSVQFCSSKGKWKTVRVMYADDSHWLITPAKTFTGDISHVTCRCPKHIHELNEDNWKLQVLSCHGELPDAPIFLWIPLDEWNQTIISHRNGVIS